MKRALFSLLAPISMFCACTGGIPTEFTSLNKDTVPSSIHSVDTGPTLIDHRDGKSYRMLKIGGLEWMASNLDFEPSDKTRSWCPGDTPIGCDALGRLYAWSQAMKGDSTYSNWCDVFLDSTGICPTGSHLPTREEWIDLVNALGGQYTAGGRLKSSNGWSSAVDGTSGNGSDAVGFAALPAGFRSTGSQGWGLYGHTPDANAFLEMSSTSAFWTRTYNIPGACSSAYGVFLSKDDSSANVYPIPRATGLSIRCVRNH